MAFVYIFYISGAGKSPREVKDLEPVMSSSKSFTEYEAVKLFAPLELLRPKEAPLTGAKGSGSCDGIFYFFATERFTPFLLLFLALLAA